MIAVTSACQGCGACLLTCPERAIRPARGAERHAGPLAVVTSRCTGCGEGVEICPADAIDFTADPATAVGSALAPAPQPRHATRAPGSGGSPPGGAFTGIMNSAGRLTM
ncbi:MAG TPA: 4Fe-4S dicluster domain-containing protein [Streptosporangiaceae bacterium]|nr:4Fe-4S dicluster domain-containing protein [Streptosporangiaceae bacterium]